MRNRNVEAGSLQIDSDIRIPIIDIPYNGDGVKVWRPTDIDLESGVLEVLRKHAVAKIIGGNHMFWIHDNPPRIHHPNKDDHSVYWLDRLGSGARIDGWTDNSWLQLAVDYTFLDNADELFSEMQEKNENLRIFHALGFAKQSDVTLINGRKIANRSIQSQYRAHLHVVDAVGDHNIGWLGQAQILSKKSMLPFFLNTPGELAIQHYSSELSSFGKKVTYSQTIGREINFDIERTMFAFDSWNEALNSVLELYNQLLHGWLSTAALIAESRLEFSSEVIEILQGCLPGFTLMKPSLKDKIAGGIEPKVNWLVTPFSVLLPQAMLQPGVLFNRLQPEEQGKL